MPIISSPTKPLTSKVDERGFFGPPLEFEKSIKFDGTDDVITTSADSTLASKTYSFWAKSTQTAEKNGIFDHGSAAVGAFRFNSSGTGPRLYLSSSSYRFWNDNSAQDDGNWHHHLLYVDPSNITNSKWIVDGVVQTPSTTSSGSADAYTSGIRIGTAGAEFFNGSLDEFAIFDGDQTDKDFIRNLYNNGRPTNLSSYSTLDHWFRMGEGKLGTKGDGESNLLFDQGPNGGLGSEGITNGDYETGDLTGWTVSNAGGQTVEVATNAAGSNALHIVSDGTFCGVTQNLSLIHISEPTRPY